ncbi:MAG: AAA family ATPase [Candidatus Delongbacteria bacterium]|nr:AAA family ATPase [Candidatus Delongbacteria bacterium]MBN2836176.1 AAA family ATPase [Candidatus Delongbacteria bacterium]
MKIRELWICKYKNIENFSINFENSENINVLIGKNGSGKSNIIEAIILIFDFLYNNYAYIEFEFEFKIKFECNDDIILIERTKERKIGKRNNDNEEELESFKARIKQNYSDSFPANILVYYNGTNSRIKEIIKEYDNQFIEDLKTNISLKKRPIFVFEDKQFSILLFSLFTYKNESDFIKTIFEKLNINSFSRIEIIKTAKKVTQESITNKYLSLLDRIGSKEKNKLIINNEMLKKVFDADRANLGEPRDLLKIFDVLIKSEIISEIKVFLKKNDIEILHNEFSEGEKQFVILRLLLEFFMYKETLYLFDEPDIYLHPTWQQNLVNEVRGINDRHHVIITTHSPHIVSSLQKENIFLMENGNILNSEDLYSFGRDTSSILYEYFKVPFIANKEVKDKITEIDNLIDEGKYEEADNEIKDLEKIRGNNDKEIQRLITSLNFERNWVNDND